MLSTFLPAGKEAMDVVAETRGLRFYQATDPKAALEGEEFICVCTNHYGYTISRTEASQRNREDTELRKQSPYRGHEPR